MSSSHDKTYETDEIRRAIHQAERDINIAEDKKAMKMFIDTNIHIDTTYTGDYNTFVLQPSLSLRVKMLEDREERRKEILELRIAELIKERDTYDDRRRAAIVLVNKYKTMYETLKEQQDEQK